MSIEVKPIELPAVEKPAIVMDGLRVKMLYVDAPSDAAWRLTASLEYRALDANGNVIIDDRLEEINILIPDLRKTAKDNPNLEGLISGVRDALVSLAIGMGKVQSKPIPEPVPQTEPQPEPNP